MSSKSNTRKASRRPNLSPIIERSSSIERGDRSISSSDEIVLKRQQSITRKDIQSIIKPRKSLTQKIWKGFKRLCNGSRRSSSGSK